MAAARPVDFLSPTHSFLQPPKTSSIPIPPSDRGRIDTDGRQAFNVSPPWSLPPTGSTSCWVAWLRWFHGDGIVGPYCRLQDADFVNPGMLASWHRWQAALRVLVRLSWEYNLSQSPKQLAALPTHALANVLDGVLAVVASLLPTAPTSPPTAQMSMDQLYVCLTATAVADVTVTFPSLSLRKMWRLWWHGDGGAPYSHRRKWTTASKHHMYSAKSVIETLGICAEERGWVAPMAALETIPEPALMNVLGLALDATRHVWNLGPHVSVDDTCISFSLALNRAKERHQTFVTRPLNAAIYPTAAVGEVGLQRQAKDRVINLTPPPTMAPPSAVVADSMPPSVGLTARTIWRRWFRGDSSGGPLRHRAPPEIDACLCSTMRLAMRLCLEHGLATLAWMDVMDEAALDDIWSRLVALLPPAVDTNNGQFNDPDRIDTLWQRFLALAASMMAKSRARQWHFPCLSVRDLWRVWWLGDGDATPYRHRPSTTWLSKDASSLSEQTQRQSIRLVVVFTALAVRYGIVTSTDAMNTMDETELNNVLTRVIAALKEYFHGTSDLTLDLASADFFATMQRKTRIKAHTAAPLAPLGRTPSPTWALLIPTLTYTMAWRHWFHGCPNVHVAPLHLLENTDTLTDQDRPRYQLIRDTMRVLVRLTLEHGLATSEDELASLAPDALDQVLVACVTKHMGTSEIAVELLAGRVVPVNDVGANGAGPDQQSLLLAKMQMAVDPQALVCFPPAMSVYKTWRLWFHGDGDAPYRLRHNWNYASLPA
ncbi:hypothetical protein As57867_018452, partial [Aphanomyces stellatus]